MWSLVVLWWLCRFRRSIGRYLDPALFDYYCNAPPFFLMGGLPPQSLGMVTVQKKSSPTHST